MTCSAEWKQQKTLKKKIHRQTRKISFEIIAAGWVSPHDDNDRRVR